MVSIETTATFEGSKKGNEEETPSSASLPGPPVERLEKVGARVFVGPL